MLHTCRTAHSGGATHHGAVGIRYLTELKRFATRGARDLGGREAVRVTAEGRLKSVLGRRLPTRRPVQAAFFSVEGLMEPPATALVVEPSVAETLSLVSSLSEMGFQVTVSDNFRDARAQLTSGPALLVTEPMLFVTTAE